MKNLIDIHYLVDSEECLLIDYISQLGIDKEIKIGNRTYNTNSIDFLQEIVLKKLFRQFSSSNTEQHFKNKYLYYLSGGAIGYLEAIYSMNYEEKIKTEITNIKMIFDHKKIDLTDYDFVSIGAAEGIKDEKIIKTFFNTSKSLSYYPIDISTTLLQLNVNKFTKSFSSKINWNIHPINADFFDFTKSKVSETIKNKFSSKPKIFMLLGGTIGNYKEDDLINNIKSLMNPNDYLVIGFELYKNENELKEIVKDYFTTGNIEFLSNPIKIIPHFSGFLNNKSKFFNLYDQGFVEDVDKSISVFVDSRVYKPTIKIPTLETDYVVAWTTRYKSEKLDATIESKFGLKKILKNNYGNNALYLLQKDKSTQQSENV